MAPITTEPIDLTVGIHTEINTDSRQTQTTDPNASATVAVDMSSIESVTPKVNTTVDA